VYKYLSTVELHELKESEPKAQDFYEDDGKKFVNRDKLKVGQAISMENDDDDAMGLHHNDLDDDDDDDGDGRLAMDMDDNTTDNTKINLATNDHAAHINGAVSNEDDLVDDCQGHHTRRTKVYNYNELVNLSNPMIRYAAGDRQKSAILAGTIVQLTALMRGQHIDSEQPFHTVLSQHQQHLYGGRKTAQTEFSGPVLGKKPCTKVVARRLKSTSSPSNKRSAVKNGAKKCGFCLQETGHVYSGCPSYKALGTVVINPDVFAANLISGQIQVAVGMKPQGAALFDRVPGQTKWLVFHGLHLRDSLDINTGDPSDLVAEVSCRASGGQLEKDEYGHCYIPVIALNTWICSQSKGKTSKRNVLRDDIL
jgi:hypothetical protein